MKDAKIISFTCRLFISLTFCFCCNSFLIQGPNILTSSQQAPHACCISPQTLPSTKKMNQSLTFQFSRSVSNPALRNNPHRVVELTQKPTRTQPSQPFNTD